jgi:hypothetical protein
MALIIETGNQVAGANSYITVADAESVAESYGVSFSGNVETALKAAYKWLNTQESQLQGDRLSDIDATTTQTGIYPRKPVYIRGNLIDENSIPVELIEAQVLAAFANEQSSILLPTIGSTTGAIKKEELDGVGSQEFFEGSALDSNETNSALQLALTTLEPLTTRALGGLFGGRTVVKGYS